MTTTRADFSAAAPCEVPSRTRETGAQLEACRSGGSTPVGGGKNHIDTTGETILRLEAEIAQLGDVIAHYERELRNTSL